MAKELPDIVYDTGKSPIVDSPNSMFILPYEKDWEYFSNLESKTRFIKGCEKLVRKDTRYRKYINKLKREVKLNHCQVLSGLTDQDCTIEMHHGPIFTLYDICEIVLDYFLEHGWRITTFEVADVVLKEHWKNHIQVVMLSTTIHQEVHDRELFINMKQAWGDLNAFLKKYKLNNDLKDKYNRYLDRSLMMDSTSYELLKLSDRLVNKKD
jgi:hypothetical protein